MEPRAKPTAHSANPPRLEPGDLNNRPGQYHSPAINTDTAASRPVPGREQPSREEGWLDLSGGQLEFGGRKFVIVEGRLTHFNPNTNEALGTMSIISPIRPSLMSGVVTLKIHRLEFMLSMLQGQPSLLPGEHKMSFAAVLVRA